MYVARGDPSPGIRGQTGLLEPVGHVGGWEIRCGQFPRQASEPVGQRVLLVHAARLVVLHERRDVLLRCRLNREEPGECGRARVSSRSRGYDEPVEQSTRRKDLRWNEPHATIRGAIKQQVLHPPSRPAGRQDQKMASEVDAVVPRGCLIDKPVRKRMQQVSTQSQEDAVQHRRGPCYPNTMTAGYPAVMCTLLCHSQIELTAGYPAVTFCFKSNECLIHLFDRPGVDAMSTRTDILKAALPIFADLGFRGATVRDISAKAGVNLAAINYHFGDKASLYVEVLRYAYAQSRTDEPMPLIEQKQHDPDGQLCAWINWYMSRILTDRNTTIGRLMFREMADPTPALRNLTEGGIKPVYAALEGIVRGVLGEDADPIDLKMHCLSIVGQCLLYRTGAAVLERLDPPHLGPDQCERIAGHISDATLAALHASARSSANPRRSSEAGT